MKNTLSTVLLALGLATGLSTTCAAGVSGAIFSTDVNGTQVNQNIYDSKCAVYLDGGPGPHAPAKAAGLPDGDYYFQVTNPNGSVLLSTDPVSNRQFHVSGGLITAYTGTGGPAHPTGYDQDHGAQGAITIQVANASCPADFLTTPDQGNVYKVWATPVGSFVGNPANVDNPCGGGCSHGFLNSQSKTDNFKALPGPAATFCLSLQKQFLDQVGNVHVVAGWRLSVTEPTGVTNDYFTDATGIVAQPPCQLPAGSYSVTENASDVNQPVPVNCLLNGTQSATLNGTSATLPVAFTWTAALPNPMVVSFVNGAGCRN